MCIRDRNMIFNPAMGPSNMILNQFFGVAVENLPRWAAGKDTAMITVILFLSLIHI